MAEIFHWEHVAAALANQTFSMSPALRDIPEGTLAIGIGDSASAGVALNCKNSRTYRSVSAWLWNCSADERSRLKQQGTNQVIAQVVIEDFSLDSCFSWLLYTALMLSEEAEFPAGLEAWVSYIDQWEQGNYLDGDRFSHSAACLHTVYAHAQLHAAKRESQNYDPALLKQGFTRCIKLLTEFINRTAVPQQGIQPFFSAEYQAAEAALAYEHQLYELVIQRAATCQLLVEQANSTRKVLIDALFLNEQHPSGLFKIFARNDRSRSWSKNGFTLLGIHRPQERGTGNDVVISVDPRSGISLQSLWRALEEAENERWGGERPQDNPRPIRSYYGGDGPNEPWWDDAGQYTLLGAPKQLPDGEPGSRLDWWQDILPLIWQKGFVEPLTPSLKRITPPLAGPEGHKRVCAWCWSDADSRLQQTDTTSYLMDTPSFQAWLAGSSQDKPVVTPYELLQADRFEAYWQSDVLVVCHQQGVTLFSRVAEDPMLELLLAAAQRIATLSDNYAAFLQQIREIFKKWPSRLNQQAAVIEDKQWEEEIFALRVNALNVLNSTETLFSSAGENRLSETLQQHWGLHDQRGTLFAQLDRLDQLMKEAIERQKSRRHRIYGSLFSALGMGIAASHVWEPVRDILTTNEYEWQLLLFKTPGVETQHLAEIAEQSAHFELITLIVFVAFALLGFILFWFFDIRSQEE